MDEKNLKDFRTCKKLANQGKSKIPPEKFRVIDENLFKDVQMDKESISSSGMMLEKQTTYNSENQYGKSSSEGEDDKGFDDQLDIDEDFDDEDPSSIKEGKVP